MSTQPFEIDDIVILEGNIGVIRMVRGDNLIEVISIWGRTVSITSRENLTKVNDDVSFEVLFTDFMKYQGEGPDWSGIREFSFIKALLYEHRYEVERQKQESINQAKSLLESFGYAVTKK